MRIISIHPVLPVCIALCAFPHFRPLKKQNKKQINKTGTSVGRRKVIVGASRFPCDRGSTQTKWTARSNGLYVLLQRTPGCTLKETESSEKKEKEERRQVGRQSNPAEENRKPSFSDDACETASKFFQLYFPFDTKGENKIGKRGGKMGNLGRDRGYSLFPRSFAAP